MLGLYGLAHARWEPNNLHDLQHAFPEFDLYYTDPAFSYLSAFISIQLFYLRPSCAARSSS